MPAAAPPPAAPSAPAPAAPAAAPPAPGPSQSGPAGTPKTGPKLTDALSRLKGTAPTVDGKPAQAPDGTQAKPPAAPDGKPADGKPAQTKPPAAGDGKDANNGKNEAAPPVKAKSLREAYDAEKAVTKGLRAEIETLKKAQADAGQKVSPELETLTSKVADLEKRNADLENSLRFTDFTRTQEYKDKYETPYIKAFNDGRTVVSKFKVVDTEGNERKGAPEDFDRIMAEQDPDRAAEMIEALFGPGPRSAMVANAREKALDILNRANEAEADYKKNGGEQAKAQEAKMREGMQRVVKATGDFWTKQLAAPLSDEKVKWQFTADPTDAKEAKILEDGRKRAGEAFKNLNPYDPKLTAEQREAIISSHAEMHNKATAYDLAIYRLMKLKKKVAEQEAKLKGYEETEQPPNGGRKGPDAAATPKGWDASRNNLSRYIKK